MTSRILTIRRTLESVCAKNLKTTILFVDFSKAFDSRRRRKIEQKLLAYGLTKETVTDYFDIVPGVTQGDTLAPYRLFICLDKALRTFIDKIKDNSFKLAKERSRRYPAQTITDSDCADDIALLANTPAQAETLLHRLEQ